MKRFYRTTVLLAFLPALLSACAPARQTVAFQAPAAYRSSVCDTASADVTTFGRANAKLYSDVALKREIADLQGHMFAGGVRRIRIVQTSSDCQPVHAVGRVANVYRCIARAQLCGL